MSKHNAICTAYTQNNTQIPYYEIQQPNVHFNILNQTETREFYPSLYETTAFTRKTYLEQLEAQDIIYTAEFKGFTIPYGLPTKSFT
eukprot:UN08162